MTRLDATTLTLLQLVQNASARLLTGLRKCTHITPVLASLHWLPAWFRVELKIFVFVFKAINKLAPSYLSELLSLHNPSRALRSGSPRLLTVPRVKLKQRGKCGFAVVGPKLWNTLPVHIRYAPTLQVFKSLLETHYFSIAFNVPWCSISVIDFWWQFWFWF